MQSLYLGIDPGLHGAIAALDGSGAVIGTWPMPVVGGEVHAAGLADLVRHLICTHTIARAAVEKVSSMPKQGVASTFSFGTGWGMVRGVLATLSVPVQLVAPTLWKKAVLAGLTHDKTGALRYCASRWPHADLVLPGCRKPHDGIADALCLAEYGRLLAAVR